MGKLRLSLTLLLLAAWLCTGCPDSTDISYIPDSGQDDGSNGTPDEDSCTNQSSCPNPVDPGCGPAEICRDGLDNNCNGQVDENCTCTPGEVQSCFAAYPGYDGIGTCQRGHQTCFFETDYGYWGPCEGSILPTPEVCDLADNNCNSCIDEDLCCTGELDCPEPGDPRIPEAMPFYKYFLHGSDFYSGMAATWSWTVRGTPCDNLLEATSGKTSFDEKGDVHKNVMIKKVSGRDTKIIIGVFGSAE